jgi:hypothetical protein
MPKQRLLTLREAADALGMDEKSVQAELVAGQLKGEKKSAWLQDKWFVYKGEVDERLSKKESESKPNSKAAGKQLPSADQAISVDLKALMGPKRGLAASKSSDGEDEVRLWLATERERLKLIVEQVMQPLVEKIATQAQLLAEKDRIIDEQAKQLKLLPDLVEKQALEARAQKEAEMSELKVKIASLKEQNEQGEVAKVKVTELESTLKDLKRLEAESKASAEKKYDQLKQEREKQVKEMKDELSLLSAELEFARRPWWKKFTR